MKCYDICPLKAVDFQAERQVFEEFLPDLISFGVDCVEYHVSDFNDEIFQQWQWLNDNFDGILSISIGTSNLKENQIIEILDKFLAIRKPYSTIIQADGTPMSRIEKPMQCIETGLLIQKQNYKAYLNLAGGTNLSTSKSAQEVGLKFDVIAFGTYARKIVEDYIFTDNFWEDEKLQQKAIKIAENINQTFFCCIEK